MAISPHCVILSLVEFFGLSWVCCFVFFTKLHDAEIPSVHSVDPLTGALH